MHLSWNSRCAQTLALPSSARPPGALRAADTRGQPRAGLSGARFRSRRRGRPQVRLGAAGRRGGSGPDVRSAGREIVGRAAGETVAVGWAGAESSSASFRARPWPGLLPKLEQLLHAYWAARWVSSWWPRCRGAASVHLPSPFCVLPGVRQGHEKSGFSPSPRLHSCPHC